MSIKYVDIKKIDKDGNVVINKTLTPEDIDAINGIGNEVAEHKEDIDDLTSRVYELENSTATNDLIDSKVKDLSKKDDELNNKIKTLANNDVSLNNKIDASIKDLKDETSLKINDNAVAIDNLDSKIKSTNKNVSDLESKVSSIESIGLHNYDDAIEGINDNISKLQEADNSHLSAINKVNTDLGTFKTEIQKTVDSNKDKIAELENSTVDLQNSDIDINNKIKDNTSRIESLEAQHKVDTTELEKDVKDLKSYDDFVKAKLSSHTLGIAENKSKITELQNSDSELSQRIKTLEDKKPRNYDAEFNEVNTKVLNNNLRIDANSQDIKELKAYTTENNALISENSEDISALQTETENINQDIEDLNSEVSRLDTENTANFTSLQKANEDLTNRVNANKKELQENIDKVSTNLGNANADLEKTKVQVNVNKDNIGSLSKDFDTFKTETTNTITTLNDNDTDFKKRISDLETDNDTNKNDIKTNKGLIDTLQTANTRMQSEIKANTDSINANYDELKDLINNNKNNSDELADELDRVKTNSDLNSAKIQSNTNDIQSLKNVSSKNAENIASAKADIDLLDKKVDDNKKELQENIDKVNTDLTNNNSSLIENINNTKTELQNSLNTKLDSVNDEIVEINSKVSDNRKDIDKNSDSISGLEVRTSALESLNAKNYDGDIARINGQILTQNENIAVADNNVKAIATTAKNLTDGFIEHKKEVKDSLDKMDVRVKTNSDNIDKLNNEFSEYKDSQSDKLNAIDTKILDANLTHTSELNQVKDRVQGLENLHAKNYDAEIKDLQDKNSAQDKITKDLTNTVDELTKTTKERDSVLDLRISDLDTSFNYKVSELSNRVDDNQTSNTENFTKLSNRIEEIYNNGIDEVQQKAIEALKDVDVDELAKIKEAADRIDYLESKGLKNYDEDIHVISAKNSQQDIRLDSIESYNLNNDKNIENINSDIKDLQDLTKSHISDYDTLNTNFEALSKVVSDNEMNDDVRLSALENAKSQNDIDIFNIKQTNYEQNLEIANLSQKEQYDVNNINANIEALKEAQKNTNADISDDLERIENELLSNDSAINHKLDNHIDLYNQEHAKLDSRVTQNETDISVLQEKVAQQKNIELVSERPENPDGQTLYIITGQDVDEGSTSMFDIADVNSKISALQTSDDVFDDRVSEIETKSKNNQAKIAELKESDDAQKLEIQNLHNVDDSIISDIKNINENITTTNTKNSEQDIHLDTLDRHLERTDAKDLEQDNRLDDIDSHINDIDILNANQELRISDHLQRISALETDKKVKDNNVAQITTHDELQDQRLDAIEKYDEQNTKDIKELRDYNTNNDSEISQLKETDTAYNVRLESLETDNTTNKKNIKDLQDLTDIHTAEIKDLHNKDKDIDKVNASLQSQIDARLTKDTEQDLALVKHKHKLAKHDGEILALHTADANIGSRIDRLEGNLADPTKKIYTLAELTTEVIDLHEKDDLLDRVDADHTSRIETLEKTTTDHTDYITGMKEEQTKWNTTQDNRLKVVETASTSYNNRLINLEITQEQQDNQIAYLDNKSSKNATDIEAQEKRIKDIETTSIGAIKSELENLHNTDAELSKADVKMRQDWTENNEQVDNKFISLQEVDHTQNARLTTLEKSITDNTAVMKTVDSRLNTLETYKTDNNTRASNIEKRITGVEQFSSNHENRLQSVETKKYAVYNDERMTSIESVDKNHEARLDNVEKILDDYEFENKYNALKTTVDNNKTEYTNLINTANTNSTNKANTAERNANAYTDTQVKALSGVDEGINKRIDELNAKHDALNTEIDILAKSTSSQFVGIDVVDNIPDVPDTNTLYVVEEESDVDSDDTNTVFDLTQVNAEIKSLHGADESLKNSIDFLSDKIDALPQNDVKDTLTELQNKDTLFSAQFNELNNQQIEQNQRLTDLEKFDEQHNIDFINYKHDQRLKNESQNYRLTKVENFNAKTDAKLDTNTNTLNTRITDEINKLHNQLFDELEAKGTAGQVFAIKSKNGKNVVGTKEIVSIHSFVTNDNELANAELIPIGMDDVFNKWHRYTHDSDGQNLDNSNHNAYKDAWSYNSTSKAISCSVNQSTFGMFISNDAFLKYNIGIDCTGLDDDNDAFAIVCAFCTDKDGVQHTISLVRTKQINDHAKYLYSLVYDYQLKTELQLVDGSSKVTSALGGWKNVHCKIEVIREFDKLTCYSSQINGDIDLNTKLEYRLPATKPSTLTDEQFANITAMLGTEAPIGFGVFSEKGTFTIYSQNIFDDPRIYNVPKDEILEKINNEWKKVGSITKDFEDKTLIFNKETGKLFWFTNGKFVLLADRGQNDATLAVFDRRIETLESKIASTTTKFEVVQKLPDNPDSDTLYMVIGESDGKDNVIPQLNLDELRESIKSLKSKDIEHDTLISAVKNKSESNETNISNLDTRITNIEQNGAVPEQVSTKITAIEKDIKSNKDSISELEKDKVSKDELAKVTDRIDSEIANLSANVNSKIQDIDLAGVSNKLYSLETQNLVNSSKIELLRKDHDKDVRKNSIELANINAKIQNLKVDVSSGNINIDNSESIKQLRDENADLKNRVQTLETKVSDLEAKLEKLNKIEFVSEIPADADADKLYVVLK